MDKDKLWKGLGIFSSLAMVGVTILSNVVKEKEFKDKVSKQVTEELAKINGKES